ncbi:hypothetical protein [Enterovirga rhinocerotis]|uniref:Uncharacterized protein n=1 Tax=Enterovirga rhinocerotis TaxID=1339210 RepID=A0A4R7BX94_9HYPH|nr:hypothetical protein [Enterovirga rhinocerotis]TDR89832.1 hypothetical protein EV668_2668 [Enterovirga rhinocerotis]
MTTRRRPPSPTRLPDRLTSDGWWLAPSPKPPGEGGVVIAFPTRRREPAGAERVVIPFPLRPSAGPRTKTGA